jgi:hypothetical protein
MALSLAGWINGLSASVIVIFSCFFGLFCIYKGRKTNATLLSYMGLGICCGGLAWLSNFLDFVIILSTGKNIDITTYRIISIISYMFAPPAFVLAMYVCTELLMPEKKWYFISIVLILSIFLGLFFLLDPLGSFHYSYPEKSGENLIDDNINLESFAGILFIILAFLFLFFCGFGVLIKAFKSSGLIRKKYLLLSLGFIIWGIFGILEGYTEPGIALIFVRAAIISAIWLWYLGLREETEKTKKVRNKKEVKIEGDLFRISKRPDQITEEEVSISKEKKICLVCKGRVLGYNFICRNCEAFYCEKCAHALEDLENECWACNSPIDESKPVKPFKKEEDIEEIQVEISKKPQKKPEVNKKS